MALALPEVAQAELDVRGSVSGQLQGFTASSLHSADQQQNASLSGELEIYQEFNEGESSILFRPFARVDQNDDERTHFDIRELIWLTAGDSWELRAGLGQVFWGVAESRNPVDIINQIDQVESLTTSDKLGQPMLGATLIRDWGNIDFFVLPYFRERTFAGVDGRPRLPAVIDQDNPLYESEDEESNVDFALRLSTVFEEWDIGLSFFDGTAREPLFQFDEASERLRPLYYQITQAGLDVQATLESWLLKAELIRQSGDLIEDHAESVLGFEYSFYGVADTDTDIGIVAEHLWDERDSGQTFQNDLLIGLRFALNDEESSEALVGFIHDLDGNGDVFTLEASRRIGNSFLLSADANVWFNTDANDGSSQLRNEDFVQVELEYFF